MPATNIPKLLDGMTREQLIQVEIEARRLMIETTPSDRDQKMIALAKKQWEREGEIEIDENSSIVSESDDDGAYVQAWVWVYNPKDDGEDE